MEEQKNTPAEEQQNYVDARTPEEIAAEPKSELTVSQDTQPIGQDNNPNRNPNKKPVEVFTVLEETCKVGDEYFMTYRGRRIQAPGKAFVFYADNVQQLVRYFRYNEINRQQITFVKTGV